MIFSPKITIFAAVNLKQTKYMKYLTSKANPLLCKMFSEHTELLISFLNALLPLNAQEEEISEAEFLPFEQALCNPFVSDNVVSVRCKDRAGKPFVVEMQMMWTTAFKWHVRFKDSKACLNPLTKSRKRESRLPIYSLNLVNELFFPDEEYYHDFKTVTNADTDEVPEGLRLIFIELPKFTPRNYGEKKMRVLWLRYLTEIDEHTIEAPHELMENPETSRAIALLEASAFTEAQLLGYDRFWDSISTAKMLLSSSYREGVEEGLKEAREAIRKKTLA